MKTAAPSTPHPTPPTPVRAIDTLPPGPAAPWLAQSLRWGLQPTEFLRSCGRRFGDRFTLRLNPRHPWVIFGHPEHIRQLLMSPPDVLSAREGNRGPLEPILGPGSLMLQEGERHLEERRRLSPTFHGDRIARFEALMRESTQAVISSWPIGRPFPLQPQLQRAVLSVMLRALLGLEDGGELADLQRHLEAILEQASNPLASFAGHFPGWDLDLGRFSPWGRFLKQLHALDDRLLALIARRRRAPVSADADVLSQLLNARDEQGNPLDDRAVRDEVFTLIMAGHESTAATLTWAFYHLLPRRAVMDRLRADLERPGPTIAIPDGADEVRYVDAVLNETMRLTPVITNVLRRVQQPFEVDGYVLPAGVYVSPCIFLAHRHPDFWDDPEEFRPERFLERKPHPYAFLPFGLGLRRCIGQAFALYQMKVVLAEIATTVSLAIAPGYHMRVLRRTVNCSPSAGLPVVLLQRSDSLHTHPPTPFPLRVLDARPLPQPPPRCGEGAQEGVFPPPRTGEGGRGVGFRSGQADDGG